MNKRALVTGAAGFLGSHLCESLLKDGYEVIGMDNMSTGSASNIELLSKYKNFTFINGDIRDEIPQKTVGCVEEIWNFACPASPPKYQLDPVGTFMTSVGGVTSLINFAAKYHHVMPKFFQASTSEIYGDPLVDEQSEDYWGNVNTVGPRSCYDEGKRAAETLLTDYYKQYGLPIRIARIFNTYGPRMNPYDGRVITNFINQALRGEQMTVYGSGEQTRSFCYVTDAIRGYRALMDSEVTTPVNIGNPNEFKIIDVAKMVYNKLSDRFNSAEQSIVYKELPQDDPKQRKPNIQKAKTLLGWEPQVQISEGLDYMIEYYKELV